MNDSIANTLANAPRERSADTRTGASGTKWVAMTISGKW